MTEPQVGALQATQLIKGNGCTSSDLIRIVTKTTKKKHGSRNPKIKSSDTNLKGLTSEKEDCYSID